MRIGFDSKRAFNNLTGLGNYSRSLINNYGNFCPGDELFLYTPSVREELKNWRPDSPDSVVMMPESLLGKTFSSAWRTYALAEKLSENDIDVFHGLSNELPVGIDQFKGRKIVTIHDLIFLRYPDYYKNIDRYIYNRKFKYACEQADLVLAASHQTKEDIIQYFRLDPDKICVTYQDCDKSFHMAPDEETLDRVNNRYGLPDRYVLCVGTLESRKNQLTVIKAFEEADLPDHKLIFVGKETPYGTMLKAYVEERQLGKRIKFLSHVQWAHLPAIYRMAEIFVYASEFEGFGIPVVEAFRSEIPALLAKSSSLIEVGGKNAMYFEKHDHLQLKEQMELLAHDEAKRKSMVEAGKEQCKLFDPEKLSLELKKIYHDLSR